MNRNKKICVKCKSRFLFWLFGCKKYTRDRRICLDSGRFARSTCPTAMQVRLRISDLPTGYCNVKHSAGPVVSVAGLESVTHLKWSPPDGVTYNEVDFGEEGKK